MPNYITRSQSVKATPVRKKHSHGDAALRRDATALYHSMTSLMRLYQFRDRDHVGYHGLAVTQCYVLECLLRRGSLTLNELASEMLLDKSTLSRVVDGLERKGCVIRKRHPDDARSRIISSSRLGTLRYRAVEKQLIDENCGALHVFTKATRRQLVLLIDALTKAASERAMTRLHE